MAKKLIIYTLILLTFICTAALAEQDGMYTYEINGDNTATITKFDWKKNNGDIYIPEMLGNRIVTAIGIKAFETTGNKPVKITLPEGIKSIGELAFHGADITYINIPLGTLEIGSGAFAECKISRFNIASGHPIFATIDNALYNKQTKTLIAWPENKEISEIPLGIVNIGDYAFYKKTFPRSKNGYSYKLPKSIKKIGKYAFAEIETEAKNQSLLIDISNIEEIDDYAFYKSRIRIPQIFVSRIGNHAFEKADLKFVKMKYDDNTDRIELNLSPYSIGDYAFYECSFAKPDVAAVVTFVGGPRFSLSNVTRIGEHAFSKIEGINIIIMEDDFKELTEIGEHAFEDQDIFGNIIIDHIYNIPKAAFMNSRISDVVLGSSVERIEESAFSNCKWLESVKLSSGLLTIEDNAFANCINLKEITIPASVTMIGYDVFKDCPSLVIIVESGSYGEVWARTSGYSYKVNGVEEDTSWLN